MTRGIRLLAALALSAALACSDPQAGTLPSVSPSPSLSASATPTASATQVTEGADDAAVAYYRTLERVAASPDEWPAFQRLIDRTCECNAVVELLQRLAREDRELRFSITLGKPRIARQEGNAATVFLDVQQSKGQEVDAEGKAVRSLPATSGKYAIDLIQADRRWLVRRITRTS